MKTTKLLYYTLCLPIILFYYLGCNSTSYSSNQLQSTINEYLKDKKNILGTIVKVNVQGKQSFMASSGFFDFSKKTPINANNKFIIGSVTKVFTAVLVHQLVEQGKVELQRPLINYLPPDWSSILAKIKYGREITVEQALCHRSGIADVTETEEFRNILITAPLKPWNPIEILQLTEQQGEPKFMPGKGYEYCNTNYLLLGALVENVTKQSFDVSLQQNILARVGMDNTYLSEGTFGSDKGGIVHGYYTNDSKIYDGQEVSVGWAQASGGIISTADDLIKFFNALVSHELFERKETFEQMVKLTGGNESYGLGLMVLYDSEIGTYYGHGGNFCGTRTMLAYFPKYKTTAVVCHTYSDNNVDPAGCEKLMKLVMKDIFHDEFEVLNKNKSEIRDILAETSKIHENEDNPIPGNWNFDLQEQWSINNINGHPIKNNFIYRVGANGEIYLLNPLSSEIFALDPNGNLLTSFGKEEEQTGYVLDVFTTSDRIYVLEMGNTCNRIKAFDKKGGFINFFEVSSEISPRVIVDGEKYVAVRSGSDADKKQIFETLELLNFKNEKGSIIGKYPAEERLIVSTNLNRGRVHIMLDDIELFPRMILHLDKNLLFLGRSDRYLVKKIDLKGNEILSFSIEGRNRKTIPANYKKNKLADMGLIGGKVMPDEMKKEILAGIPDQQVFFTHITTDKQGLIYLFIPDVGNMNKQEIDIFSHDGTYLYSSVIELAKGLQKAGPIIVNGEDLLALVKSDNKDISLIKYRIKTPKLKKDQSK